MTWLLVLLACSSGPKAPPSGLAAAQAFWRGRPLIEQPLTLTASTLPGVPGLSAAQCGGCHVAIYEEWRVSTHAHAWTDLQFQAEIGKPGSPRWMCINCHTPDLRQQAWWPTGLVDGDVSQPILARNPGFDMALQQEGITCIGCHLREGVIHGPGLGGDPPHPVVTDPDYRSGALCTRCHEAVGRYPDKTFVCTFETGSEVSEGPYEETCVDCHMPRVERPAAVGGPVRNVARHWWGGAGIPKVAGVHPPPEATPPGLAVRAEWVEGKLAVTLENARAGHQLPTGDPERWVQVDITFQGVSGPVGAWSTRIGQTWDWRTQPRKLADNRLAPKEQRVETVDIPDDAVHAVIVASSHRITSQNADYHGLLGRYPISVQTHRFTVQVR